MNMTHVPFMSNLFCHKRLMGLSRRAQVTSRGKGMLPRQLYVIESIGENENAPKSILCLTVDLGERRCSQIKFMYGDPIEENEITLKSTLYIRVHLGERRCSQIDFICKGPFGRMRILPNRFYI